MYKLHDKFKRPRSIEEKVLALVESTASDLKGINATIETLQAEDGLSLQDVPKLATLYQEAVDRNKNAVALEENTRFIDRVISINIREDFDEYYDIAFKDIQDMISKIAEE